MSSGRGRYRLLDGRGENPGERVVAFGSEVNVLVEGLASRRSAGGLSRQRARRVHQRGPPCRGGLADDLVEPGISAERDRVEISRTLEAFQGPGEISQAEIGAGQEEFQFRVTGIEGGRLLQGW